MSFTNTYNYKLANYDKLNPSGIVKENIYVNPSWNLGIEQSSYDKFIIFNDDIIIPYNFVSQLESFLTEDKGIIGIDAPSVIKTPSFDGENIFFTTGQNHRHIKNKFKSPP